MSICCSLIKEMENIIAVDGEGYCRHPILHFYDYFTIKVKYGIV